MVITKYKTTPSKEDLKKFAGLWADLDGEKIKENILKSRKDGSEHQKTLLKW